MCQSNNRSSIFPSCYYYQKQISTTNWINNGTNRSFGIKTNCYEIVYVLCVKTVYIQFKTSVATQTDQRFDSQFPSSILSRCRSEGWKSSFKPGNTSWHKSIRKTFWLATMMDEYSQHACVRCDLVIDRRYDKCWNHDCRAGNQTRRDVSRTAPARQTSLGLW